jgi:hypothetical protein
VTVLAGAEVTTTDDAVVVGGVPRIHLGGGPRGMFVQQSTEYTYGGLYEQINEELVGESWYMDVGRRVVTRESGDTIFTRALDFGNVALEGTPASHFEIDASWPPKGASAARAAPLRWPTAFWRSAASTRGSAPIRS